MKILHIHTSLKCGGIESIINGLANEMAINHEVTVCSIFEPQREDQFWRTLSDNVTKVSLNKTKKGFSMKEVITIYKFLKNQSFDIVHIHGFFHYYFLAIILLHRKVKFFYTVHSDAFKENSKWEKRILSLKKYCFRHNLIHPITISQASQLSFEKLYRCHNTLIYNGIPNTQIQRIEKSKIDALRTNKNTKILINIGRIDYPKNQIVLCEAISELISEGYDIKLIIAGPIAKKDIFDKISQFLSERIIYFGEITKPREYLVECDAMVMPSIYEGMPLTLLEAMSVGCIPICSPVGGIPNVIEDEVSGFLSKSASKTDFMEALKRWLNTPVKDLYSIHEFIQLEFKNKYTIQSTASKYIDAYLKE